MRVVFVQKFVPHYRLPFFERVRDQLHNNNIEFVLLYSEPDPYENSKVRIVYPDWGIRLETRHYLLFNRYLYWAKLNKYLKRGDFVVVEHAAKLLNNYPIYIQRQLGRIKMGYFGHGKNFQATTELTISSWVKNLMLRRVDHWFAYTEVSKSKLMELSVGEHNITVVNNTLAPSDNSDLKYTAPEPYSCVFVGGLYSLKLIPFLLRAAKLVHDKLPEFKLYIVGDGPEKDYIQTYAQKNSWVDFKGALYGLDRDIVLSNSNAILMPGLVGLIAIDSFQFERPIITSSLGEHSPEIAYLKDGENCLIDEGKRGVTNEISYSDLVCRYLNSIELQSTLKKNCRSSAQTYTIEHMADSFVNTMINK